MNESTQGNREDMWRCGDHRERQGKALFTVKQSASAANSPPVCGRGTEATAVDDPLADLLH